MTGILQFAIANTSWIVLVRIISIFGRRLRGGIHDCDSDRDLLHSAVVGIEQCRGDAGGAEPGREAAGSRGAGGVADGSLQHDFSWSASGIFFVVFATPVVQLFVHDPAVVPIAATALRTFSCGNIGYAYGMVMLQAFNGAGDTLTPTIVNFFGFWVLELPLAWWLAVSDAHGVRRGHFLSVVIAECSIAVASIVLFRRGRWARQQI